MQVRFWGTRGSLPVALTAEDVRAKVVAALAAANGQHFKDLPAVEAFVDHLPFAVAGSFGGHSSCVELVTGGPEHVICDMGSGLRPLGQAKLSQFGPGTPQVYHVFLSHLHWDHLMGIPFFGPAYIPGNHVIIHGCHPNLAEAVRLQMKAPCFPVDFAHLGARIEFDILEPGRPYTIAGLTVTAKKQLHAGDSYGYRFERDDKVFVYSTDSEHRLDDEKEVAGFVDFFRQADLVVFDAMYCLAEAISVKADWGHSSNVVGVDLCLAAGAKRLALFHHEPVHDDAQLARIQAETRRYAEISADDQAAAPLEIVTAYDGLHLTL